MPLKRRCSASAGCKLKALQSEQANEYANNSPQPLVFLIPFLHGTDISHCSLPLLGLSWGCRVDIVYQRFKFERNFKNTITRQVAIRDSPTFYEVNTTVRLLPVQSDGYQVILISAPIRYSGPRSDSLVSNPLTHKHAASNRQISSLICFLLDPTTNLKSLLYSIHQSEKFPEPDLFDVLLPLSFCFQSY